MVYEAWLAQSSDVVLVLIHGLGAHPGRWESLSKSLLEKGISLFAIDLKNSKHLGL